MTDEEQELQNRQMNEDDAHLEQKKLDWQMKEYRRKANIALFNTLSATAKADRRRIVNG